MTWELVTMNEIPQEQPVGANRQRTPRKKTLKGGQIIYSDQNCVMDCVVFNISETGAGLRPADSFKCPPTFTLKLTTGETYHCKVVWQQDDQMGVVFEE